MNNCLRRWYTVVDEMSVDEMSVDELSWNRYEARVEVDSIPWGQRSGMHASP